MSSKSVWAASIVSIILVGVFSYATFKYGLPQQLNEVGDSIAGMAGALAFIWIVAGMYMQKQELYYTRKEFIRLGDNSDFEKENLKIKLYISSLEHQLSVFHTFSNDLFQQIFQKEPPSSKYDSVLVFINQCAIAEQSKNEEEIGKIAELKSIQLLIRKYVNTYSSMVKNIESSSEKELLNEIYISSMLYSDIFKKIQSAANLDKLGNVFKQ